MTRLFLHPLWPKTSTPISIPKQGMVLGRNTHSQWKQDPLLSPEHLFVRAVHENQVLVCDRNSWNGTFYRFTTRRKLHTGDEIRMGQQWVRWEAVDPDLCTYGRNFSVLDRLKNEKSSNSFSKPWGRLIWLWGPHQEGSALLLTHPHAVLGRTQGQIQLPRDPYLSSQHLYWHYQEEQAWVEDANSRNGSFVRLKGEHILPVGASLWIGQQVFEIRAE